MARRGQRQDKESSGSTWREGYKSHSLVGREGAAPVTRDARRTEGWGHSSNTSEVHEGGAPRRPQVLRTYSERLTTGRITRKTSELMVVTKKKIQKRMRSTAMAMTRHSLRRFLSASWLSWRLRRILSARTISSCARLVPRVARLGL